MDTVRPRPTWAKTDRTSPWLSNIADGSSPVKRRTLWCGLRRPAGSWQEAGLGVSCGWPTSSEYHPGASACSHAGTPPTAWTSQADHAESGIRDVHFTLTFSKVEWSTIDSLQLQAHPKKLNTLSPCQALKVAHYYFNNVMFKANR